MNERDEIARINAQWWEKMVAEGCGFTQPWLDLDIGFLRQYADGLVDVVPEPLLSEFPHTIFSGVEGKDVLCLASGGGQQSAVFSLLGARVTVVDLAEGQLARDREAAAHYGYPVATIQADMRDLSSVEDASFDLVYQGPSIAYIPDVRQVFDEVARVLRRGGVYRVVFSNPGTEFVDYWHWDGVGYRISMSYSERIRQRADDEDSVIEFRHYLSDIFNGLITVGMSIQQVEEAPHYLHQDVQADPGSWEHWLTYVVGFAVVAKKM